MAPLVDQIDRRTELVSTAAQPIYPSPKLTQVQPDLM
jgi:hypothetical protein